MPTAELHLLALRRGLVEIAGDDPLFAKIHVFDPTKRNDQGSAVSIIRQLRSEHFDSSISFFPSNTWQYNLLPFLAGIKQRYGFLYHTKRGTSCSWLCTKRTPVNPAFHDVQQNLKCAELLVGQQLTNEIPVYPRLFGDTDTAWARTYVQSNCHTKNIVAIHAGSSADHGMDAKRWPAERFGQLADRICKKIDATVVVFGGPDEQNIKEKVAASMTMPCHLVEPVSLKQTAALIVQCKLSLCNDSGLMHVASSMKVPTIAIFGPTDERRNGPVGKNSLVVRKPMAGFPVWTAVNVGDRSVPKGINAMDSLLGLSTDDAWRKIEPWLATIV